MAIDLMIYESGSGGDLNLKNEDIETVKGLVTQVYLALFGGNIEENTSDSLEDLEQRNDWWGNDLLPVDNQFNSNFERALTSVALNSNGITILENAAKKDLKYLRQYADISISGSVVELNRFQLEVTLQEPNEQSVKLRFIWDGTRNELIESKII